MRYLLLLTSLLLICGVPANAQPACCLPPENSSLSFKTFAGNQAFVAAHLPPQAPVTAPGIGKMVNLKTGDGKEAAVYEVKSGKSEGKILLVFHEWWGLNDHIKKVAERLHRETGATVLALDLYDRKITDKPEIAATLMQGVKEERVRSIIRAALDYGGKFSRFQFIGWCMGGGWSLQAALMAEEKNYGCVVYYGMPEKDTARLATLSAPVLGIFARRDAWITPALVQEFKSNMQVSGKELELLQYDAEHAFANPSNPAYDKVKAAEAMLKSVAFIRKNFEQPVRKSAQPSKD